MRFDDRGLAHPLCQDPALLFIESVELSSAHDNTQHKGLCELLQIAHPAVIARLTDFLKLERIEPDVVPLPLRCAIAKIAEEADGQVQRR